MGVHQIAEQLSLQLLLEMAELRSRSAQHQLFRTATGSLHASKSVIVCVHQRGPTTLKASPKRLMFTVPNTLARPMHQAPVTPTSRVQSASHIRAYHKRAFVSRLAAEQGLSRLAMLGTVLEHGNLLAQWQRHFAESSSISIPGMELHTEAAPGIISMGSGGCCWETGGGANTGAPPIAAAAAQCSLLHTNSAVVHVHPRAWRPWMMWQHDNTEPRWATGGPPSKMVLAGLVKLMSVVERKHTRSEPGATFAAESDIVQS
jgi:hypothetical protein